VPARDDIRSSKRAGRHVRAMVRRDARLHLRKNAGVLSRLLAGYVLLSALVLGIQVVLGVPAFQAWFLAGLLVGLVPYFMSKFMASRGLTQRELGADAEEWTAQELARLDKRRWVVIHDVPLERSNIDHVVIGPGCIYAVETKWTARDDHERFLNGAAGQAERQAEDLRQVLSEHGIDRDIIPMLIVWGPGIAGRLGPGMKRRRRRVQVAAGLHSDRWRAQMNEACTRFERDLPAISAIETVAAGSSPALSPAE
jgi:hypothetical protein